MVGENLDQEVTNPEAALEPEAEPEAEAEADNA